MSKGRFGIFQNNIGAIGCFDTVSAGTSGYHRAHFAERLKNFQPGSPAVPQRNDHRRPCTEFFGGIFDKTESLESGDIEKFGIRDTFGILPGTMLLGSIISFFVPGVWGSAPSQGVVRVTLETVDQSNRKAYQALVPDEKRGRVSIFIDSYLPSFGTILGSLIAFAIISWGIASGTDYEFFSALNMGVAIIGAIISVVEFFFMRAAYEKSLLSWQMKRRSRGSNVLDQLDF